jgi:glycogen debranching enzyme
MLMSKKFMSSVWSWDHCFNALAVARLGAQAALEQFMAPFVLQAPNGALPDMWNPNTETVWGVTKPPIHGWCFGKLMEQFAYPDETLQTVYEHLEKWTNWWFTYRDEDHDGIPGYPQGCDSGWDNSTVFDNGYFISSPDLPAYLAIQMNTLARISKQLGDASKAEEWKNRSAALVDKMLEHLWKDSHFVAIQSHSHGFHSEPTSLLVHMPVVLGDLLPKEVMDKTVEILEKRFLTEHGFATEAPDSPRYEPDGYWRGPIWAPTTYLLIDGLRSGGYNELAKTVAKRYLHMSDTIAKGNYENFDALTGVGLRAPGYTWSASVYMLLLSEYGE